MILTNKKYSLIFYFLLMSAFIIGGCSEYQKILKSDDTELKLQKAIEYYEAGDYFRAQNLLSDIRSYYRGTDKAEKINFYNAYCHYGTGQLSLAAYFFREFAMTFPASKYREEAEFMAAYCYYQLSPSESLEQVFTKRAIDELQLFIERYPESPRRDTANTYINNLQQKLELKAFNNARLYYRIGSYRAAVTALNNVLIDYPDTAYREEILYYIVKSYYDFAVNSVRDRQLERFRDVVNAYYNFVDYFAESDKIRELERIYNDAINFIQENNGL